MKNVWGIVQLIEISEQLLGKTIFARCFGLDWGKFLEILNIKHDPSNKTKFFRAFYIISTKAIYILSLYFNFFNPTLL